VTDRKPPRSAGTERETLVTLLQFQRESMVRKVEGVDDDAARRPMVPSGTSLLWLLRHLAWGESLWIEHRFLGGPHPPEVVVADDDTVAAAVAAYRETWRRVDGLVAEGPDLDWRAVETAGGTTVSLRWILAHLLEETARHAGHADILRELLDGDTGR
jgi:hypothetical protein